MIVIVDDDYRFAQSIQNLFEADGVACNIWNSYENLVKKINTSRPKVMLLDLNVDNDPTAGLSALEVIKARFPAIKTLVLTIHLQHIRRAFKLGVDGYLAKRDISMSIEYVKELINEVRSGNVPMSNEVRISIAHSFRPIDLSIVNGLNSRERQIILLAASDKKVPQIAEKLGLARSTVETYVRNIKARFECHTIQGVVALAFYHRILNPDDITP